MGLQGPGFGSWCEATSGPQFLPLYKEEASPIPQLPGLLEKWKKEVARSQGKMSTVSDFRHSWGQPPSCHLLPLPTARVGFIWWYPTLLPLTKVAAAALADTQGEGLVLTGCWACLSIPEPITVAGGQARLGP